MQIIPNFKIDIKENVVSFWIEIEKEWILEIYILHTVNPSTMNSM